MVTEMFYDVFAKEYVLDREEIAPPERYIPIVSPIVRGTNYYIESWCVNDDPNESLNIAFFEEDYCDPTMHSMIIETTCKKNDCILTRLRYIIYPSKKFDEIYNSLMEDIRNVY